jgi:hypothetical protein
MGCDIHIYVERKIEGKWVSADHWATDPDGYTDAVNPIYDGRNYRLFAILANVRNYSRAWYNPISEPKGLPDDVSHEVSEQANERWSTDGHSHSFFTLAEIKAFDWQQKVIESGFVHEQEFADFMETGRPSGWSQATDPRYPRLSNEEMKEVVNRKIANQQMLNSLLRGGYPEYVTEVSWEWTYAEAAGHFYAKTIPRLEMLSYGNPENVRIVFWFDS